MFFPWRNFVIFSQRNWENLEFFFSVNLVNFPCLWGGGGGASNFFQQKKKKKNSVF